MPGSEGEDPETFDRENLWWIAYTVPANCGEACHNSLLQMRQTQAATGPYQSRVSTLLIQHENSDPAAAQWATENAPEMVITRVAAQQWREKLQPAALEKQKDMANAGQLFLIDPMGALFMTYPGQTDEEAAIKQGKGILKDLKQVLKLSKIG
jgi:cytochrome oxidase Cu insertion factor (SCO1/SenC/PrrC family)